MKAFILDRYGKKRALRLADMPHPELRDDEVLVEVHAAGVNLLDSKIRDGEFKLLLPYRLPLILGHDVAGVVVKVGPRVRQFKLGDEVYARPDDFRIGSFAELIAVKEASLKSGGKLITISGPPDPEFGRDIGANGFLKIVMRLLSLGIRRKAKSRGISFSFLFMKANGSQLREITRLIDAGPIRPVMDRVFPFESTNEAMAYVEGGRAKGKAVVKVR